MSPIVTDGDAVGQDSKTSVGNHVRGQVLPSALDSSRGPQRRLDRVAESKRQLCYHFIRLVPISCAKQRRAHLRCDAREIR